MVRRSRNRLAACRDATLPSVAQRRSLYAMACTFALLGIAVAT